MKATTAAARSSALWMVSALILTLTVVILVTILVNINRLMAATASLAAPHFG
jgi:hypothetical protein